MASIVPRNTTGAKQRRTIRRTATLIHWTLLWIGPGSSLLRGGRQLCHQALRRVAFRKSRQREKRGSGAIFFSTVTLASAPVKLTGKGKPMASFEDVNGDGRLDLVIHVTTSAFQLTASDTTATVKGKTFGAVSIKGTDTVRVVP